MRVPLLHGLIRRRILVNFRVDPAVMSRLLPAPFTPKLHQGHAIAGICLIRLERIRPTWAPPCFGITSENMAHRVAVQWTDAGGQTKEGVYIPRRDTGSWLNHWAGGRLFPGEHSLANFRVQDDGQRIAMDIQARDGAVRVALRMREADALPATSCFASLAESSAFFEGGCVGYSATRGGCRLDGMRLETIGWKVKPLAVDEVASSFFANEKDFPAGSVAFDHALVMRDIAHRWRQEADMRVGTVAGK